MLKDFFIHNLDIVFLFYGAAFFVLGIAILLQPRSQSIFKLADTIWLLGWFGLIHGLNEWLDMIAIIKEDTSTWFKEIRVIILTLSFVFLFEFGRKLIASCKKFFNGWLTIFLSVIVFVSMTITEQEKSIFPRYFLCFTGGLMSAYGLLTYYYSDENFLKIFRVRRYFFLASFSFLAYSIFSGIVTPKANFFPASVINTNSFINALSIPVQVFRAICALLIAFFVGRLLRLFDSEVRFKLKNTVDSLMVSKSYLENILNSMIDNLIVIDIKGKIKEINLNWCKILGYEKMEIIGKPVDIIFEGENPFDSDKIKMLIENGYLDNYELLCISKDKIRIPMVFSESLIKDLKGNITGFVVVGKDMREIKNLQEKLLRSEKLATIGRMASIMEHEFKNQLGIMKNAVYFIKSKSNNKDEKVSKHLDILDSEIAEGNRIIESISRSLRTDKIELRNIDLKYILLSSVKKIQIPSGIVIDYHIADDLPNISGDDIQLNRLFINIILNAIESMEEKGTLTITAVKTDNYVKILLGDTGHGIKEEDRKFIFEPFFTTKSKGTGLGLFTAKTIVEAHTGLIDIESDADKGTRVIVKLPIKE